MDGKGVGETRRFSFSDKTYRILEILENPNIKLYWTWTSGVCPHCKERITRNIEHTFYSIEVLGDTKISKSNLKKKDIYLRGYTLDKRTLILPIEKYNEVFDKSKNFKKFKEVN